MTPASEIMPPAFSKNSYPILAAESGEEALRVLVQAPRIDLLFTDVVLPGTMSGRQLADEIAKLRPGLPVLFTTGYTRNAIVHDGRLDPGVNLLNKPYTQRDLAYKIKSVIEQTSSGVV
jgi:CheY-like chemotaxis protein